MNRSAVGPTKSVPLLHTQPGSYSLTCSLTCFDNPTFAPRDLRAQSVKAVKTRHRLAEAERKLLYAVLRWNSGVRNRINTYRKRSATCICLLLCLFATKPFLPGRHLTADDSISAIQPAHAHLTLPIMFASSNTNMLRTMADAVTS